MFLSHPRVSSKYGNEERRWDLRWVKWSQNMLFKSPEASSLPCVSEHVWPWLPWRNSCFSDECLLMGEDQTGGLQRVCIYVFGEWSGCLLKSIIKLCFCTGNRVVPLTIVENISIGSWKMCIWRNYAWLGSFVFAINIYFSLNSTFQELSRIPLYTW